jgi:hypothetical protein
MLHMLPLKVSGKNFPAKNFPAKLKLSSACLKLSKVSEIFAVSDFFEISTGWRSKPESMRILAHVDFIYINEELILCKKIINSEKDRRVVFFAFTVTPRSVSKTDRIILSCSASQFLWSVPQCQCLWHVS